MQVQCYAVFQVGIVFQSSDGDIIRHWKNPHDACASPVLSKHCNALVYCILWPVDDNLLPLVPYRSGDVASDPKQTFHKLCSLSSYKPSHAKDLCCNQVYPCL